MNRSFPIVLPNNGLRVLLVQDTQVYQAAAALSIGGAGQFADPNDLPGLAHLCEHMALSSQRRRGRRRPPSFRKVIDNMDDIAQEEDFENWLADREGSSNGFTALDNVCFQHDLPSMDG